MKRLFVSGIGTDVGKTVAAAVLAKAWELSYWKPIQAGELAYTDSDKVREWTDGKLTVLEEGYRLTSPMSPHAAAKKDNVRIALDDLQVPDQQSSLLIEGAGGLLVPINEDGDTMLDMARRFEAEVLLVSCNFLGSINQTLLSCELLRYREVPVRGILFSGAENAESERIISSLAPYPVMGRIPEEEPGPAMVERQAKAFSELLPFRHPG